MRVYRFPALVHRLHRGTLESGPWSDFWVLPTAKYPLWISPDELSNHTPPATAGLWRKSTVCLQTPFLMDLFDTIRPFRDLIMNSCGGPIARTPCPKRTTSLRRMNLRSILYPFNAPLLVLLRQLSYPPLLLLLDLDLSLWRTLTKIWRNHSLLLLRVKAVLILEFVWALP